MKNLIAAALAAAVTASLASCGKSSKGSETEYIYGRITSISGNDAVLLMAEYSDEEATTETQEATEAASRSSKRTGRSSGGSSDSSGKRSMPEGFDPSQFGGSMPEGFTKPEGSGEVKSFDIPQSSGRYKFTGEQEEIRIPVGVTVTTELGVQTDFDVLSSGDMIKCSIEKTVTVRKSLPEYG